MRFFTTNPDGVRDAARDVVPGTEPDPYWKSVTPSRVDTPNEPNRGPMRCVDCYPTAEATSMRFFPNEPDAEDGRRRGSVDTLDEPTPEPEVAGQDGTWRETFDAAMTTGDRASKVSVNPYGPRPDDEPPFAEPMMDYHLTGSDAHRGRIDLAQALHLRALAAAAGQNVAETQALTAAVQAMTDRMSQIGAALDTAIALVARTAGDIAAQADIAESLKIIAGSHVVAGNERTLTVAKVEADLERLRSRRAAAMELYGNLTALGWWQWIRRGRIKDELVNLAVGGAR